MKVCDADHAEIAYTSRRCPLCEYRRHVWRTVRLDQKSLALDDVVRAHVLGVLALFDGNRRETAAALGIPQRTLYRRLLEYGVASKRRCVDRG